MSLRADHDTTPSQPLSRKAEQNQANRASARQLLEAHGIEYRTNNDGIHLMVEGNTGYIDFWPGTGRWRARECEASGFGVRALLDAIESGHL